MDVSVDLRRSVSMSALFSIMMFGESIGIHNMLFFIAILLIWLFVFYITGDSYDMKDDILASMESK